MLKKGVFAFLLVVHVILAVEGRGGRGGGYRRGRYTSEERDYSPESSYGRDYEEEVVPPSAAKGHGKGVGGHGGGGHGQSSPAPAGGEGEPDESTTIVVPTEPPRKVSPKFGVSGKHSTTPFADGSTAAVDPDESTTEGAAAEEPEPEEPEPEATDEPESEGEGAPESEPEPEAEDGEDGEEPDEGPEEEVDEEGVKNVPPHNLEGHHRPTKLTKEAYGDPKQPEPEDVSEPDEEPEPEEGSEPDEVLLPHVRPLLSPQPNHPAEPESSGTSESESESESESDSEENGHPPLTDPPMKGGDKIKEIAADLDKMEKDVQAFIAKQRDFRQRMLERILSLESGIKSGLASGKYTK